MAEPLSTNGEPIEITWEEFERLLDERARRDFGMSLEEFTAAWDAGELPDTSKVMSIAIFLGGRNK
jgi:hypothetical protein